jgi:hypothetical protein
MTWVGHVIRMEMKNAIKATPTICQHIKHVNKIGYWLNYYYYYYLNCWVLHPVARVSTNVFLKSTVRNNVSGLDFIVHYLLYVSAPIGGHLQVKCTQNIY